MNAPNTIYIDPMWCEKTWSKHLHNDTDIAYIRGDVSYELAKTVEAQKAEMARLRKSLDTYGRHNRACVMLDPYDPSTDCTCGFTAALRGGSMSEQDITNLLTGLRYDTCDKHDSCEPCKGLRQDSIAAIESLQQTVAELRAERERLQGDRLLARALFTSIAQGALTFTEIDQIAPAALASPPAAEEPAKDQDIERHIKW